MDETKLQHFKKLLEEEHKLVESALNDVAVFNEATGQWEAKGGTLETMSPIQDENEFADTLEELDAHKEELPALRTRYGEIKEAMRRMEAGTYGICEVCQKPIEEERLDANPAARTCLEHM